MYFMATLTRQTFAFQLQNTPNNKVISNNPSARHDKSRHRKCPHYVYTPEQQEDFDNKKDEEKNQEKDKDEDPGQVLESLLDKLDKSKANAKEKEKKKENKAMSFLRKRGKVGGNNDFTNAVGSDEGSGMAAPIKSNALDTSSLSTGAAATLPSSMISKSQGAYQDAIESGIIDDLTESFPTTSSGSEWRGTSDRSLGGTSEGAIRRETVNDKTSNVLVGQVSNQPNAFLQMVTDLANSGNTADGVDASNYDGIELDILSQEGMEFNVHLRSDKFPKKSYRHTASVECLFGWSTIRIPFTSFVDAGDGTSVDYGSISRLGIVALKPDSEVYLALSGARFYSVI